MEHEKALAVSTESSWPSGSGFNSLQQWFFNEKPSSWKKFWTETKVSFSCVARAIIELNSAQYRPTSLIRLNIAVNTTLGGTTNPEWKIDWSASEKLKLARTQLAKIGDQWQHLQLMDPYWLGSMRQPFLVVLLKTFASLLMRIIIGHTFEKATRDKNDTQIRIKS